MIYHNLTHIGLFIFRGSCFGALLVYNDTELMSRERVGTKMYRFNDCTSIRGGCDRSPNYCCCLFTPPEEE